MSKGRAGDEGSRVSNEAVDWLVENESDGAAADRPQLASWIKWSARTDNRIAYADVVQMRDDLRRLSRPPGVRREDLLEDAADDPDVVFASSDTASPLLNRTWVKRAWAAAAAALLVLGVILAIYWPRTTERILTTAAGEQTSIVLTDGSRVRLGGDTRLKIRYTDRARIIELERGAALFQVQHDIKRPFVVLSDRGTTTAVGTEFEVRRYEDHVQVWVREGAVVVAPLQDVGISDADLLGAVRLTPTHLSVGQQLSYGIDGKPTAPRLVDPHLKAAWAEGRLVPLVYRNRPLTEVIEDIQPYTPHRIILDATVRALLFTGIVKQEDADAWVHELTTIYPVEVIDCRLPPAGANVPGCTRPEYVVVRTTAAALQGGLKSAER